MITRYILNGLLEIILTALGVILTPFLYFVKGFVRKHNIIPLWCFLNDTVQNPEWMDKDWGDFGRFSHNWLGFMKQNAFRNSHWNLRVILGERLIGEKTNIKGEMTLLNTSWNYKVGKTYATYKVNGIKRFRMSMIKEVGKFYIHCQLGTNDKRYVYKVKLGLINK